MHTKGHLIALRDARQEQYRERIAVKSLTAQVKALAQLLQNFAAANVRASLWPSLRTFVATYGYDRLSILQRTQAQGLATTHILYSDVDGETLDLFQRSGWRHPIILQAWRASEPFAQSEKDASDVDADPALIDQDLYEGEGLVVPLANGDFARGVAVLGGDDPDLSPVARSIVHVAAETAFHRAQILPAFDAAAPAAGLLSPREVAILSWAAAGKTDAEIGQLLKISARTVRFHTDNAKRKLRVTTRIQAVTESLRLGFIKL